MAVRITVSSAMRSIPSDMINGSSSPLESVVCTDTMSPSSPIVRTISMRADLHRLTHGVVTGGQISAHASISPPHTRATRSDAMSGE